MFKSIGFYFTISIIIFVGALLLFNDIFAIGIVILGLAGFLFFLWAFMLKDKTKLIDSLKEEIKKVRSEKKSMEQELEDYSKRKLNISEVNTVLELGLIEVDTSFKRTVNKQFMVKDRKVQFIGVLHVDFIAKYGVDFRKLMYKINEEQKEISIANAEPEFLSFSKRNIKWEITEILEFNTPFMGSGHWRTNPKLDSIANEIKEETRILVEKETENGPGELKWVVGSLRKHVERALELIIGVQGYKIRFTSLDDDNYKSLYDYAMENDEKEQITKHQNKELIN